MDEGSAAPFLVAPDGSLHRGLEQRRVEAYWTAVSATLAEVLGAGDAPEMVEALRRRLDAVPPETRLHFYHASPLQVASDLAAAPDAALSEAQLARYRRIIAAFDPSRA